jgi:GDPmannose 4,6-dehydratase
LDAKRDWGFAPEYVECMWQILQQKVPDDFVIGTGEAHSVREFLEAAFSYVDLDADKYVKIDPRYFRPTEPEALISDSTKARKKLGWKPKIRFKDLVKIMVDADMRAEGLTPIGEGDKTLEKFSNKWWKVD